MPYSTPSTPMASPSRETAPRSKKGFHTPPTHVEDIGSPSVITGPMPGIPRRASSRPTSPAMSRAGSSSHQSFSTVQPTDGLPQRPSHTPSSSTSTITGLPQHVGTLGLKLFPSPTRPSSRNPQDSLDSTSTIESSLPSTPRDDDVELPAATKSPVENEPIPFPPFAVTPRPMSANNPLRASMSPPRPGGMFRQHSGPMPGNATHSRGNGSLQLVIPGSASTSQLAPSPALTPPSRPIDKMLRKKSGEVVRPSLKQRSMSTPDLTRLPEDSPDFDQTGRTFGEERSKSVRFADHDSSNPSELVDVVVFDNRQKPASVLRTEEDGPFTETETENDTDASDFVQFRTGKLHAARALDDAKDIVLEGGSRVPRVRCDFSPDARHALDGEMVVMERAELKTVNGALCLQGTTIVRNVAYQKWVAVRFTMDHWSTVSEVSGSHVCHIPSSTTHDEGWDRFSFSIKLEDFKRKLDERQLMICIRFSVDGQEWWDSNNGLNYQFNFKRVVAQRKTRHSLPPGFHERNIADFATAASLPGLRQNSRGGFSPALPSSRIAQQLGGARPAVSGPNPRDWTFPTLASGSFMGAVAPGTGSSTGTDSPMLSPPPNAAFRPPGPPDVHTHLTLSGGSYCAPSPPQSPPKEASSMLGSSSMISSPQDMIASQRQTSDEVIGQPTTVSAPAHERRSSWAGQVGSWDSFAKVMTEHADDVTSDGSTTPVASGPDATLADSQTSSPLSPPHRALTMKRSTGDLQALRAGGVGLMTPPSSQETSPSPMKISIPLPDEVPMSPCSTSSQITTGESSPVNTVTSSSSFDDVATLRGDSEPTPRPSSSNGNHQPGNRDYQLLSEASMAEFISKFCFFTSPRTTPMGDDIVVPRTNYVHVSGRSSPTGFPFPASREGQVSSNGSAGSTGPTGTPRAEYDSAMDAFALNNNPSRQANGHDSGRRTPTTSRPGPGPRSGSGWGSGPSNSSVSAQ